MYRALSSHALRSSARSGLRSQAYSSVTAWGAYVGRFAATPTPTAANASSHASSSTGSAGLETHARTAPTRLSLEMLFGSDVASADVCITAVGAGVRHALIAANVGGIDSKTSLLGFGINRCKQLGGETRAPTTAGAALLRQTIEGKVVQIACGREHSAILVEKNDGTRKVVMCGGNAYGQLGFEPHRPSETPELQTSALRDLSALSDVLAPAEVPVKIQCGLDHTAILTSAGRVFAMGWGADGQLGAGAGSTADHAAPVQVVGVDGKQRIVDISSTTDFTLALTEDSTLYYWGNAEYGQCMTGEKIDRVLSAMRVPFSQGKAASIAAGGSHALVLDSCGRVHVCGYGALGLGPDTISVLHPAAIKGIEGVTFIAASTDRCLAIDDERRVYSWGLGNTAGRLGNGTVSENAFAPQQLDVDPELVDPQLVGLGNDICIIARN